MAKTIRTLPNQSLLDMILTEYGTLEAGIKVAAANGVPISDVPATGASILMPDVAEADTEGIVYLRRNNITIGTLASPGLSFEILLRPRMRVEPNTTGNPHLIGYYAFDLVEDVGFENANSLQASYPSENRLHYITEERYVLGHSSQSSLPLSVTPMPDISIPYELTWTVGLGYMMVYCDMGMPLRTVSFTDVEGNVAFAAPVTILDNVSQSVVAHLIADVAVEVVSETASAVTLRLVRSHPAIGLADFGSYEMTWTDMAVSGVPDPLDPENADKTILTLGRGTYTIGVRTTYYYTALTPALAFPPSAFSMVIGVY